MLVQVVNFKLTGVTEAQYGALCDQLAPAFAAVPGLSAKYWIADSESGTYGGVYIWNTQADLDAFLAGELFAGVASHPNLVDITSRVFGVLSGPTSITTTLIETAV